MSKPRIVILGAGFGGAFAAKHLTRLFSDQVEIELLNKNNYFVFQPLLPEVAAGIINSEDAVTPLRVMLPDVKFRMADVVAIDFEKRQIRLLQGSHRIPIHINYDHLVIATGLRANLDMLPGFADHSFSMRNLWDAYRLRNHVIQCLEHADVTKDAKLKSRLLTFVVAGGGFSGVETMGELAELIRRVIKLYPNVDIEEIRLTVIQRQDRILVELPESLGEFAHKHMEERGIEILVGKGMASATATRVTLDDGHEIATQTLIATIGNGPTKLVQDLGLPLSRGKIQTDRYMRVDGHENVWALGDCAAIPLDEQGKNFAPPTAQFATAEADQLAKNLLLQEQGGDLKPFNFEPKGSLASLGHYSAVAEVYGFKISGLFAWFLWRGFYVLRLPGFSTKLRVALDWFYDYFLPRSVVQIHGEDLAATRYVTYRAGDTLFLPGQIADGLYSVEKGALESRVRDPETGEEHVRRIGPGDHWGERSLMENKETQGELVAVEDSHVLIFGREDLAHLRKTLPAIDAYFNSLSQERYPASLRRKDSKN